MVFRSGNLMHSLLQSTHALLQALIFILKREFMLIGWMVVYILSYVLSHIYECNNI